MWKILQDAEKVAIMTYIKVEDNTEAVEKLCIPPKRSQIYESILTAFSRLGGAGNSTWVLGCPSRDTAQ